MGVINIIFKLIFIYNFSLFTFDWYLIENIFIYFINVSSIKEILTFSLIWFIFIFCIFLKCGIAPFFFLKPVFFKGLPIYTLLFYITYFYFFFFIYLFNKFIKFLFFRNFLLFFYYYLHIYFTRFFNIIRYYLWNILLKKFFSY